MKFYGKSILTGIVIAIMLFAVHIPSYANDTDAYFDDFESKESPAFQASATTAGSWIKPAGNAEYKQDYIDADRGHAFKATVTGTTNARNLEYNLKKQETDVVLFETLFKVEDFKSEKRFILRTDNSTELFATILTSGKINIGKNTSIDIEAGKWYKLTSKLDVLNKKATNTLTKPEGTYSGENPMNTGSYTYAKRVGVALMKTGATANDVSSSLWLDDFSVDYDENCTRYSEAVYSPLSYDTTNITGSAVILKNKDIRFFGDGTFEIYAEAEKCVSMDLMLKDSRSRAELWIGDSKSMTFENGSIKNTNKKLTNYSNNCYYKLMIAETDSGYSVFVFDENENPVAHTFGGQNGIASIKLRGAQNIRIKNVCSVQQRSIIPEKRGLGNGIGNDRIKLVFPYDISEETVTISLSGGDAVCSFAGDKTIELYGLSIGTAYNLSITGSDAYGNTVNREYKFLVKDSAYTFEFGGFFRNGTKLDKASAGNVDMILNVIPN
jgi:hypothetical protein